MRMTRKPIHTAFSFLAFAVVVTTAVVAQDSLTAPSATFQCGVLNDNHIKEIPSTDANNFDIINVKYDVGWLSSNTRHHMMPHRTNWHIYAIPDGQGPARLSSIPEGLITPEVKEGTLSFPVQKDALYNLGYIKGDSVEAAINLFIPLSQLRIIQISGINDFVEIIVTEVLMGGADAVLATNSTSSLLKPTIIIRSSGVSMRLYVNTPYSKVDYHDSGMDNTAVIDAARDSSVVASGVAHKLSIKSDYLTSVEMSGVDQDMLIEGSYGTISMSGVNCRVRVHGGETGCNAIEAASGDIDTSCQLSNETVTVPTLDCIAESEITCQGVSIDTSSSVINTKCPLPKDAVIVSTLDYCVVESDIMCEGISTGATVGIALASLLVLFLCVALCAFCCGGGRIRGGSRRQDGRQQNDELYATKINGATTDLPIGSVVEEAEVIGIEPAPAAAYAVVLPDPEQALPSKVKNGSTKPYGSSMNTKTYE